jgi:hypothetical protein
MKDEFMRDMSAVFAVIILFLGLLSNGHGMAAVMADPSEEIVDQSPDRMRHFSLSDGIPGSEEYYGYTQIPVYQPLEIHASDDLNFQYMARSPYYKVYFKGKKVRMSVGNSWIEFELKDTMKTPECTECEPQQEEMENAELELSVEQNLLSVSEVFESVDLSYKVDTSLLTEMFILKEQKQFEAIIQKISWGGNDTSV